MKIIRKNVFETNSSSTHSITMCVESDYEKFKNGELYLYQEKLVTKEELEKEYKYYLKEEWTKQSFEDWTYDEASTYEQYCDDYLEDYCETFKTPEGETIVAFGKYGQDY